MILAPLSRSSLRVGNEARIRPSSVIVCPSSGTLRSQRISTRLPARSPRSETDFTLDPFPSKVGEWRLQVEALHGFLTVCTRCNPCRASVSYVNVGNRLTRWWWGFQRLGAYGN